MEPIAGLGDAEDAACGAGDHAGALAGGAHARDRARLRAGAVADRAGGVRRGLQRHRGALDRGRELDRGLALDVLPAARAALGGAPAAAGPEKTAEQVTEVSGRGVGMDVVKRNIGAMGGRVDIESMRGIGTRMTVRLPLTLAILDGMSVAAGKETYIIPLGYVVESLQVERNMVRGIAGVERLIQVRGEFLPIMALHEIFGIPGAETRLEHGIMVVVEADGIKAALFIDALLGQHQVVIKSLETNYRKVAGISGATIMGDGHVALILDIAALAQMARASLPAAA